MPFNRPQWRDTINLKATLNAAGFTPIPMAGFAGGKVYIPTGSSVTLLTFYSVSGVIGTPKRDNTAYAPVAADWTQVCDKTNTAITLAVAAGKNVPLPAELFADGTIQIYANAAGDVDIALQA